MNKIFYNYCKLLLKIIFLISLNACALLERHSDSGYAQSNGSKPNSKRYKVVSKDKNENALQTMTSSQGVYSNNDNQTESFSGKNVGNLIKNKLKTLENSLMTKKEIEQYSKYLPWFENANEKIEFLSLPNFEAKQDWVNERKLMTRHSDKANEMKEIIDAQDITLGMPQDLVKKSWGEPDGVDVSGNPQFKNERWKYNKYISTQDGYKLEKKLVYFEGGKVVGWEVE